MADTPSIIQVALEPTSQKILEDATKIKGETSVTGARVANITDWLGSPTSASNSGTSANVHAKLNWMTTYINYIYSKNAGIKNVQKGRFDGYVGYGGSNANINISYVSTSRSFLIVSGRAHGETSGANYMEYNTADIAILDSSGTKITFPALDNLRSISMTCNWQVIEFN